MTSASVAVKRLQSESLQQKSLNELKQDAAELGLGKEEVKQFGSLTYKQTWLDAIGSAIANEFEAVETEEETPVQPSPHQHFGQVVTPPGFGDILRTGFSSHTVLGLLQFQHSP